MPRKPDGPETIGDQLLPDNPMPLSNPPPVNPQQAAGSQDIPNANQGIDVNQQQSEYLCEATSFFLPAYHARLISRSVRVRKLAWNTEPVPGHSHVPPFLYVQCARGQQRV